MEESVADSRTGRCRGRVHRATLSTWESGVLARELRAAGGAVQPASVLPGCQICGAEPTSGASPRGLWDKKGRQAGTRQLLGWVPSRSPCGRLLAPMKELCALSQGSELTERSWK